VVNVKMVLGYLRVCLSNRHYDESETLINFKESTAPKLFLIPISHVKLKLLPEGYSFVHLSLIYPDVDHKKKVIIKMYLSLINFLTGQFKKHISFLFFRKG